MSRWGAEVVAGMGKTPRWLGRERDCLVLCCSKKGVCLKMGLNVGNRFMLVLNLLQVMLFVE